VAEWQNGAGGERLEIPNGSKVRLSGLLLPRRDQPTDSYELLVSSPRGVQVTHKPSWWTPARGITCLFILLAVLGIALLWIHQLQRQVERRSRQLQNQIMERERAEREHLLEKERSRIARDLHDDLGASLTEITMLATLGAGSPPQLQTAHHRFATIAEKARAVVNALDVIVWLVNPRKDALPFLATYLGSYAEEFLASSGISCRLKIPIDPSITLPPDVRHSLFLAVKESLNNIVRHAHASEVLFEIALNEEELEIIITDNGQGFVSSGEEAGDGLVNLKQRLHDQNGVCTFRSAPGSGTSVSLLLPLKEL
jgi:signal transduction histidine kinase